VYEQTQPADRRAAFDHRHQVVRFGALDGASEIELVRAEHQPVRRNGQPPDTVGLAHVEHDLFVGHQLIVQRQVVAVGVEVRLVERIKDDVFPQLLADFMAG
jgi:hypothetical protein